MTAATADDSRLHSSFKKFCCAKRKVRSRRRLANICDDFEEPDRGRIVTETFAHGGDGKQLVHICHMAFGGHWKNGS